MNQTSISPDLLVPLGKIVLLGSFGFSLLQGTRGAQPLPVAFERLIIGFLGLMFFQSGAKAMDEMSSQLIVTIGRLGDHQNLKALLLDAFKKAANSPTAAGATTSFNIPEVLEQAWRTGVWGIMTSLVEGVFLISSFVLECAQEVLWSLVLLFFPLAAGLFPVFPKMMINLVLYAVELSFWFPMLCLVELATGSVAAKHMATAGSLGLYVVGVEIIAIILILFIPSLSHRFLSGAVSGDFNSHGGVILMVRKAATSFARGGI